jgi:transposase
VQLERELSPETIRILWRLYRQSKNYQVRTRAHCILLINSKYKLEELIEIFGASRKTIYNWRNNWSKYKLVGLYNQKGRGRKKIFNKQQEQQIKQWVKQSPRNLKKVIGKIKEEWGIVVSKDTVKRILKCSGMKWKRLRKVVGGQPKEEIYERKRKILKALQRLSDKGSLDLRYLDETGFCLTPYVPYAWQEQKEKQGIESKQSKRLNVLGLMNRENELYSYIFETKINSEIVIKFLDLYVQKINKRTVVVLDNAPIHRSKAFQKKIGEWRKKKMEIFWLPTYSPHLNLIEILWRFMKYEWIETQAYKTWKHLTQYVEHILQCFGDRYVINFA